MLTTIFNFGFQILCLFAAVGFIVYVPEVRAQVVYCLCRRSVQMQTARITPMQKLEKDVYFDQLHDQWNIKELDKKLKNVRKK